MGMQKNRLLGTFFSFPLSRPFARCSPTVQILDGSQTVALRLLICYCLDRLLVMTKKPAFGFLSLFSGYIWFPISL